MTVRGSYLGSCATQRYAPRLIALGDANETLGRPADVIRLAM